MSSRTIRIGLCGLGTVGQGVWKHLSANRSALEARLGIRIELAKAAVRDPRKVRTVNVPAGKLVAYYQHNQSPDVAFFCRTSGAEKALADAEACALSLVATADGEGDGAAACEPE